MSDDDYTMTETKGSFLPPPYKDVRSIFPSDLVVDTFPLTVLSGQTKTGNSKLDRTTSSNILKEKVGALLLLKKFDNFAPTYVVCSMVVCPKLIRLGKNINYSV